MFDGILYKLLKRRWEFSKAATPVTAALETEAEEAQMQG